MNFDLGREFFRSDFACFCIVSFTFTASLYVDIELLTAVCPSRTAFIAFATSPFFIAAPKCVAAAFPCL